MHGEQPCLGICWPTFHLLHANPSAWEGVHPSFRYESILFQLIPFYFIYLLHSYDFIMIFRHGDTPGSLSDGVPTFPMMPFL